jgi:ribonuclease III
MAESLAKKLEIEFNDPALLETALYHRSRSLVKGNDSQRLEFLGDAILEMCVSEMIYHIKPPMSEGQMSRVRAFVVDEKSLASLAGNLNLGSYIKLGPGELASGGRHKPSILADTLEAVIGACFVSNGFQAAQSLIHRLWRPILDQVDLAGSRLTDYKTQLQEYTQAHGLGLPQYTLVEAIGPDNSRIFTMSVDVPGLPSRTASGKTKKTACQEAAKDMLQLISASQLQP